MKKTILIPVVVVAALVVAGLLWQGSRKATADTTMSTTQETTAPAASQQPALASTAMPEPAEAGAASNTGGIKWISWDEAVEAHARSPKMLFIDVYTDWCGWCKVMDRQTFTDPKVIKHLNDNYYAVKFNAESEPPVVFRGQEYKVVSGGRRGIHTLAYALLEGELSYPSYVYLNQNFQRITVSKGFKPAEPFLEELQTVTQTAVQ